MAVLTYQIKKQERFNEQFREAVPEQEVAEDILEGLFWHFGISRSGVSRQDVRFRFLSTLGVSGVRNETRHS